MSSYNRHNFLSRLAALLFLQLLLPTALLAASHVQVRSESLVRFLERDTVKETDALIVPAYEYLQFDLSEESVSFHANGWGRVDVTDNDFFSDQTAK